MILCVKFAADKLDDLGDKNAVPSLLAVQTDDSKAGQNAAKKSLEKLAITK